LNCYPHRARRRSIHDLAATNIASRGWRACARHDVERTARQTTGTPVVAHPPLRVGAGAWLGAGRSEGRTTHPVVHQEPIARACTEATESAGVSRLSLRVMACARLGGGRSEGRTTHPVVHQEPIARVCTEATESAGVSRVSLRVMACAGAPSTTCDAPVEKDLLGRPAAFPDGAESQAAVCAPALSRR
jgi:hypothetical protein